MQEHGQRHRLNPVMVSSLIGLGLLLLGSNVAHASWAAATGHFERTLSTSGSVDMTVRSGCGDIELRNGSANQITIAAHISVGHSFSGNPEQRVHEIESNPPVEQTGNVVKIEPPSGSSWSNVCISYVITAPAQTHLVTRTGSGNVKVDGIHGPVDAESGSGEVFVNNIGSMAKLRSGSGNVQAAHIRGEANVETGSGNVSGTDIQGAFTGRTGSGSIKFQQTAPGPVHAETGSGDIALDGISGSLQASTGSGTIHAQGDPKGPWHVSTGSGNVDLRLAANASADVAAHSSSGTIHVGRPLTVQGTMGHKEVHGKMGNGGALLEVSTGSGDISID